MAITAKTVLVLPRDLYWSLRLLHFCTFARKSSVKAYHTSRGPIEANLEATYNSYHLQIDFSPFHNQGTRISLGEGIECGAEMGLPNQGTPRYQNCLDLLQSCSLHIQAIY